MTRYPITGGADLMSRWHLVDAAGTPLCGRPVQGAAETRPDAERHRAEAEGTVCRFCIHRNERSTA